MLIVLIYFALGCVAGIASGMLGVGGGIIIIPGLLWLYHLQGFSHQIIMHLAAGTSLGVIAFGALAAMLAKRKQVPGVLSLYKQLMPGLVVGVLLGAYLASRLAGHVLMVLFALLAYFMAFRMWFDRFHGHATEKTPMRSTLLSFGMVAGMKSGMLGIGGGILTVPFFTHIGTEVKKAMTLAVLVSLTVAMFGSCAFAVTGWGNTALPAHSLGYVYWPALVGTALGSLLCAPFGVWLNHRLPNKTLRKIFAVFLVVVATRMLF